MKAECRILECAIYHLRSRGQPRTLSFKTEFVPGEVLREQFYENHGKTKLKAAFW